MEQEGKNKGTKIKGKITMETENIFFFKSKIAYNFQNFSAGIVQILNRYGSNSKLRTEKYLQDR